MKLSAKSAFCALSFVAGPLVNGATVVTTVEPFVASEGSIVSVNLNATLGPVTDTVDDVSLIVRDFGSLALSNASGIGSAQVAVTDRSETFVDMLPVGATVGPTLVFGGAPAEPPQLAFDSLGGSSGEWGGGTVGYMGIAFNIDESLHYGFLRVAWNLDLSTTGSTVVVDQIGYNTVSGAPAVIGVPEPSQVSFLLSVGLLGLGFRRR